MIDEDGVVVTYVYENVEVEKTGRVSQRPLKSGKVDELVEIKPIDSMAGWSKKWVREDMLFVVV